MPSEHRLNRGAPHPSGPPSRLLEVRWGCPRWLVLLSFGLACGLMAAAGRAGESAAVRRLGDLSLEQLMNEPVTSVSKKETKLSDSPAAISVITSADIRRIGATT